MMNAMYLHVYTFRDQENVMRSNIAKWGNSLAVRLPSDQIKALGLRAGAAVEITLTPAGEIRIAPAQTFDKAAFIRRLKGKRDRMPESASVMETLRNDARY
jgi:antitoxin MazE